MIPSGARGFRRRAAPILIVAASAGLGAVLLGDALSLETLRDNREALLDWRDRSYLAAVAGFMALHVAVVAFSLPGSFAMTVAGGFLFGLAPGAAFAVLSGSVGATLVFLAARAGLGADLGAGPGARRSAEGDPGLSARIGRGLQANAVSCLLLLRLVPVVPFILANLAPAYFGVGLRMFFLTTLVGIAPGTAITAWIGAGLGEAFDRGETPGLGLLLDPLILGPVLGLCALAALPMLIRPRRRG